MSKNNLEKRINDLENKLGTQCDIGYEVHVGLHRLFAEPLTEEEWVRAAEEFESNLEEWKKEIHK